MRAWNRVLAI
jgi:hypothetical protein